MINCYIPPTNTIDSDQKDTFYETLERTFNIIPRHCIKIVNTQERREKIF